MRGALVVVALGAPGCNVVFGFDEIHPAPNVFSAPGPRLHAMGYDFAKPLTVALAADDPATIIYYTVDGSTPTLDSMHAPTPVTGLSVAADETLSYFGTVDGGDSTPVADGYFVDSAKQSISGYHVTQILLDGTSPVVVASPGQVFSNATARVQAWVQTSCPMCAAQVVYGVDDTDQGCLFDTARDDPSGPGVYPGFTRTAATFKVTAPMEPGVHLVRIAHIEENTCADAIALHALMVRPDVSRIGAVIVQSPAPRTSAAGEDQALRK